MSDRGWFPPPSRPREVENGLRARSSRGAIGEAWWSRRFIDVLEGLGVGTRLQRGKNYARRGQVISLDIEAGMVTSVVQGSRDTPYRVRVGLSPFGKREWARVEAGLAANAWYAAKLLAGEMPEDIEDVFTECEMDLFPTRNRDLAMDCSCPDWEVPCKHLAAVFYLLAEAFDDNPFLILAWRGREREELLANLAAARATGDTPAVDRARHSARPLEECLDTFFRPQGETSGAEPVSEPAGASSDALSEPGPTEPDIDAFLDQLPPVEVEVRGRTLPGLLRPAYRAFRAVGPD